MNMLNRFNMLKLCEGDGGGGTGGTSGEGNPGEGGEPPKTFDQEQVNSMIAAEKRKNISSVYKDLGFESAEEAKAFISAKQKEEEDKKDELTKAQERANQLEAEKKAEQEKTERLNYKFKAIEQGCDPGNAEDVVVLAQAKITSEKGFDTVLKEIKEQYPSMFTKTGEGAGTGSGGTHPRTMTNKDVEGMGKRLAEARKGTAPKKNAYFND